MAAPREYSVELRQRATRMAMDARQDPESARGAIKRVADQLGVHPEALRNWVRQAEVDGGVRPGTTTDDAARLAELEREVRELRRATEEAKVVRGDWVNPAAGKVTLTAFYADWSPRQVWLSSTRENADMAVAGVTFGDMPLRSIRRSHVEGWVKQMASSLAPTTIDTRFTIVRGVFRAAVADRLIPSDPTVGVVLPRKRKAEAAMSSPTNADVALLLNAAEPPNRPKSRPGFTAFVALCAFAGLRRGEALGVQVGDIDFLARTLRVKRQIQRAKAADVTAGKDLVEAVAGITVIISSTRGIAARSAGLVGHRRQSAADLRKRDCRR